MSAARILFASVHVIATTCFDKFFLFYVIAEKIAFHESLSLLCDCFKRHFAALFEASELQEVPISCFISAVTI